MQDHRHRPSVKLSTRRHHELDAARRFLLAGVTDAQLAESASADRLARHAQRSLNATTNTPTIRILCPGMDDDPLAGQDVPANQESQPLTV
ncbi:MAG: hypothetical protein KF787_04050 [Phycisphaeraceae bacterium]|nr:hypothetical protein [Phycisphaerae bacterium]MBX3391800.1 hypothetical protein [Phycisphaeraceae bacterium]